MFTFVGVCRTRIAKSFSVQYMLYSNVFVLFLFYSCINTIFGSILELFDMNSSMLVPD